MSLELSTVFFWGGSCAMYHRPLTSEARFQSQPVVCVIYVRVALGHVSTEYFGFLL
jgi:hypothetical protein